MSSYVNLSVIVVIFLFESQKPANQMDPGICLLTFYTLQLRFEFNQTLLWIASHISFSLIFIYQFIRGAKF